MEIVSDQFSPVFGTKRGSASVEAQPSQELVKGGGSVEALLIGGEANALRIGLAEACAQLFLYRMQSGEYGVTFKHHEGCFGGVYIGHYIRDASADELTYYAAPVLCDMCGSTTKTRCGRLGCA